MGKTAPKIEEKPTTLDAALSVIESLRTHASEAADDLNNARIEIEAKDEEISDLNHEIELLEDDIGAYDEAVDLLACSIQKIKAGRIDETIADMQIWLNRNDSGRKAQCAAIAVML